MKIVGAILICILWSLPSLAQCSGVCVTHGIAGSSNNTSASFNATTTGAGLLKVAGIFLHTIGASMTSNLNGTLSTCLTTRNVVSSQNLDLVTCYVSNPITGADTFTITCTGGMSCFPSIAMLGFSSTYAFNQECGFGMAAVSGQDVCNGGSVTPSLSTDVISAFVGFDASVSSVVVQSSFVNVDSVTNGGHNWDLNSAYITGVTMAEDPTVTWVGGAAGFVAELADFKISAAGTAKNFTLLGVGP